MEELFEMDAEKNATSFFFAPASSFYSNRKNYFLAYRSSYIKFIVSLIQSGGVLKTFYTLISLKNLGCEKIDKI